MGKGYVTVALPSIHARDLKYFWESRESTALYSVLGEESAKGTVASTCSRITNTVMNMNIPGIHPVRTFEF